MKNAVWSGARVALLTFAMIDAAFAADDAPSATGDAHAGYLAGTRGDYDLAAALLTRAIGSSRLSGPTLASAYINRGVALRRQGRFDAAIEDYTRALELKSDSALALSNRGLALAKWGRYGDAIRDLTQAIAIDPSNAKVFLIRGNAHFDKGAFADAINDYDQALRIDPHFRAAEVNRRDAQERMLRPDRPCTCTKAGRVTDGESAR